MQEPFSQLITTLNKVQDTMAAQLTRLAMAPHADKVRLPRLQKDAGQFTRASTALLGRMMREEAGFDLILQAKALVTFFDKAEQRAAALLGRQGAAGTNAPHDQGDEALHDVDGDWEIDGPVATRHVASSVRVRSTPRPNDRGGRNSARIAKLGLAVDPSAAARPVLRRRPGM
jgi:hypothetical protein